jgi:hypothetical protein
MRNQLLMFFYGTVDLKSSTATYFSPLVIYFEGLSPFRILVSLNMAKTRLD